MATSILRFRDRALQRQRAIASDLLNTGYKCVVSQADPARRYEDDPYSHSAPQDCFVDYGLTKSRESVDRAEESIVTRVTIWLPPSWNWRINPDSTLLDVTDPGGNTIRYRVVADTLNEEDACGCPAQRVTER